MKSLTLAKGLVKLVYQNYGKYFIFLNYGYIFSLLGKIFSLN